MDSSEASPRRQLEAIWAGSPSGFVLHFLHASHIARCLLSYFFSSLCRQKGWAAFTMITLSPQSSWG
jgi:hypothetical protein